MDDVQHRTVQRTKSGRKCQRIETALEILPGHKQASAYGFKAMEGIL